MGSDWRSLPPLRKQRTGAVHCVQFLILRAVAKQCQTHGVKREIGVGFRCRDLELGPWWCPTCFGVESLLKISEICEICGAKDRNCQDHSL